MWLVPATIIQKYRQIHMKKKVGGHDTSVVIKYASVNQLCMGQKTRP